MKSLRSFALLLVGFIVLHASGQTQPGSIAPIVKTKKILFVVTSCGEIPHGGKKTGLWLEEFASPYYYCIENGAEVTVASPNGGETPIAPGSTLKDDSPDAVKRYYNDSLAQDKLRHTVPLVNINAADFDAVYYPGGHGPMWDLPDNTSSVQLIESFYAAGKPIAFVCHGPAALKNVKSISSEPLIKGKRVTGYSNSEEYSKQSTDQVPFLLEDMLKEKGASYEKGKDWQSFVIEDGLLITGQNPASSEEVAKRLLAETQPRKT